MTSKSPAPFFLFAVAAVFLFFFLSARIPLWSSDEGRYGEIAREMLESGDRVVPHFNYIDYLEKPVLSPLLTSLAFQVFGVSSLTARLVSIFAALGGILLTYLFTRRLFDARAAGYAALVLMTSAGYVFVGRFAVIDMQMLFLTSVAIFSLMTGYFEKRRRYYLLAYVFMGLAFLTKGLMGMVLPFLILFVFLAWTRRLGEIKKLSLGWAMVIVAAVTLPWVIAISLREPEFLQVFILQHHFKRFALGSFGRSRPFWFFFYILPLICLPWTLFIPSAIARVLRAAPPQAEKAKFLVSWMAVMFVFFSLPKSKLPYYIVPVTVPVAVLAGTYFEAWTAGAFSSGEERKNRLLWKITLGVTVPGFLGLGLTPFFIHAPEIYLLRDALLPMAALGGIGALAYAFFLREKKQAAIVSLAGMIYIFLLLSFVGMLKLSPLQSTRAFAAELLPVLRAEDIVAIYSSPDHFSDLPFHLKRRVLVAGADRGTLRQESLEAEHAKDSAAWFYGPEQFVPFFNGRSRRIFCLLEEDELAGLQALGLGSYVTVMRSQGRLLISNDKFVQ